MPDETAAHMARFWDARARENANYFVDNRLDYNAGDDEAFWREGEATLERALALVGAELAPGDVVLDLGCGVGRLTRAAAGRCAHVHALDVSGEMLARARHNLAGVGNVSFHHGDGTSLAGLDDASVDAVVSLVVFQHIPDPAVTLGYVREIGRVLRPGGWAVFQVSDDPAVHARPFARPRLRIALGRAPKGQDDPAWRGSAVPFAALQRAVGGAGMTLAAHVGAGTQYLVVRCVKSEDAALAKDVGQHGGHDEHDADHDQEA
jgi:SAM-dependent methyltransferase